MAQARPAAAAAAFTPMTGSTLWICGGLLALANFMAVLDTTIANVSVPNIAGGLAVSPSQGTWVITSYAVAEAITVPADRLAGPAVRGGAGVHLRHAGFRALLGPFAGWPPRWAPWWCSGFAKAWPAGR